LKTTPTAEKTLRTGLPQTGHSDAAGSVNDCTSSNRSPQSASVQAYSYVGIAGGPPADGLALTPYDC
jgi:hypothetical protein